MPSVFGQEAIPSLSEWKPKLEWNGDLRYRFARSKEDLDDARTYQQLRARLGLRADVNESTKAHIRLATASSAISTNQTMGDSSDPGMARRPFGIDWAYIDWNFLEGGYIWLGRSANPYWAPGKVQTIYDSDLAFEGLSVKWERKGERQGLFANLGAFIISENYTAPEDEVDTGLVGVDVGYVWKGETWSWTSHLGNHQFLNVKDKAITRVEKDAKIDVYSDNPNERFRGNTVYVNDPLLTKDQRKYYFAHQFILFEVGSEFKQKLGPFDYTAYFDYVMNYAIGRDNKAYEVGVVGRWKWLSLSYAEIRKERDSVLGSFTDSDANGGGTDADGLRLGLGFQIGKDVSININDFSSTRGIASVKRKFAMTHVDFAVSF